MKKALTHTLCLFAMTALPSLSGGCQPPDLSPSPGLGDPVPRPLNDPQVTVLATELQPWLAFDPAIITLPENGPMQVEVPVRNMANRMYLIAYRFTFYDVHGRQLASADSWPQINLEPKQRVRLQAGALSNEAVDYRLEINWNR